MAENALNRLRAIVARLRDPAGGCPWDLEQTHASLRAALIEEAHETLDAITAGDDVNLCEELGDLLLHVVMHAQIAAERGAFDFDAIASGAADKMVRRHPHIFANESAGDSAAVIVRWDEIKRREKAGQPPAASPLDGVPAGFPALIRAQKIQAKAARVGFDWQNIGAVLAKVREEMEEVSTALAIGNSAAIAEELGDLLFSVVNLARWRRLESELLLRSATEKFSRRFARMHDLLLNAKRDWAEATPAELDALWEQAKTAVGDRLPATERNQNSAV
ncbi:MAG: nucleoside triphosphate pyrophosphohydrolase [Verrucomicrobia bacterium]|nr:nucleoside triphosphate pyrophosphohydrolase [Verrucomicrobiota bacterium]